MHQHTFSWFFSEDLDIFRLISYKVRLFTLQQLWPGRNDTKIAIMRMFISGYNRIPNHLNMLRVDGKIFVSAKKYLRKKKFPDTCGHGLSHAQCTRHLMLIFWWSEQ